MIENDKKIAYVFTQKITEGVDWKEIKKTCAVDGIKVVAFVELGIDADTRNLILENEVRSSDGFVEHITLEDLFSLMSDYEYSTYKRYVERFSDDIKRLIGYRTMVVPSESSLSKMKISLESELKKKRFVQLLRDEGIHDKQIKIIKNNYWERELYKTLLKESSFAESFASSEWYYRTHTASSSIEQVAIIAGYLKSVEQLLYTLVQFSVDTGKTIKRKGREKTRYREANEQWKRRLY